MTYKTQHAKVVFVEVSIGNDHGEDDRTIERFQDAIRQALTSDPEVGARHVTFQRAYYIIDGHVCLPSDYDPETKDRKPGTHPPVWAGGPTKAQLESPLANVASTGDDDAEEEPQAFVRVKPTRTTERHPNGRRIRSDKGATRGSRSKEKA